MSEKTGVTPLGVLPEVRVREPDEEVAASLAFGESCLEQGDCWKRFDAQDPPHAASIKEAKGCERGHAGGGACTYPDVCAKKGVEFG